MHFSLARRRHKLELTDSENEQMDAQHEYEYLRAMLPATVTITLSGDVITLAEPSVAMPIDPYISGCLV